MDGLLAQFAEQYGLAQARYVQFVAEGIKAASPWASLKGQVFLGDAAFVQRMKQKCSYRDGLCNRGLFLPTNCQPLWDSFHNGSLIKQRVNAVTVNHRGVPTMNTKPTALAAYF